MIINLNQQYSNQKYDKYEKKRVGELLYIRDFLYIAI